MTHKVLVEGREDVCISTASSDKEGVDDAGNMITYMFVRSVSSWIKQDREKR